MYANLRIADSVRAIVKKRILLFVTAAVGSFCFAAAPAFGQNWTLTTAPTNSWVAVAASADCSKIAAVISGGGIYNSLDAGTNWSMSNAPTNNWAAIACSTNGLNMIAAVNGGGIWVSSDSGASWLSAKAPSNSWSSVTCSADGTRLAAAGVGAIWISADSGNTWNLSGAPSSDDVGAIDYLILLSSDDGTKLVALGDYGRPYISTDAGSSWTRESGGIEWANMASSADLSKIVAGISGNSVWVSENFGANWTDSLFLLDLPPDQESASAVASSADGSKLFVLEGSSPIYISALGGVAWFPINTPNEPFSNFAVSANSNRLIAVVNGGGIYTCSGLLPVVPAFLATKSPEPSLYDADLMASITTGSDSTTVWFQWGIDTNYGRLTPSIVLQNVNALSISNLIAGLTPYSVYHCQAVASNVLGTVLGGDVSFTTVPRFVQVGTNTDWSALVLSADGRELAATSNGVIYISTNLGLTFMPTAGTGSVFAASSNGSAILAVSGSNIYASMDRGATWASNSAPAAFSYFAAPSSAQNVVATDGSANVYTSTNFGATWKGTAVPLAPTCLASSADGTKYFFGAVSYTTIVFGRYTNNVYTGWVYGSTNSGDTWTSLGSFAVSDDAALDSIACSADGSTIIITGLNGTLTSTNGGASLSFSSLPHSDSSAASSADGHQLIVGDSYFNFSVSPDTGNTWFRVNLSGLNDAVAGTVMSSADGNTLAVLNGSIYLSLPPPSQPSALSVATSPSNGSLAFQLTGQPGYSYAIQASSNLVNWTNIAILVNSNGTMPFTDPTSTSYNQRFYRAIAP